MARLLRIEFPGAFYHVTSRGNRKQTIFISDDDRFFFFNCLREAHERFGVIIHVYCLMQNHYHLFLETPSGNLSRIMHFINLKYSNYFNLKHQHCGHTFQSRFHAILVQATEYAKEVAAYIHLNPVRAGIVDRPEEYDWSNYREYLGIANPLPWTENAFVLRLFGASLPEARKEYEKHVMARLAQKQPNPLAPANKTGILGSPEFIDHIRKSFPARTDRPDEPDPIRLNRIMTRPELRQILLETEAVLGPTNRQIRKIAVYISHMATDHPLKSIGGFFGIGESAVADICRRMKKELTCNDTLARSIKEITLRLLP